MYPGRTFRYTLKKGLIGHDVWALQLNLNHLGTGVTLVTDGDFGNQTLSSVKNFQTKMSLVVDGVAGPLTQRRMALELIRAPEASVKTPPGLMKGLVEGESGYFVGCVNWSVPPGVDCGWIQDRVEPAEFSEERFRTAFDGVKGFTYLANMLRNKKNGYYTKVGSHQRAWELAILYHNWPYAAERLASGKTLSTADADWVIAIGVPGVRSPAQWATFYVNSKTAYVTEWTV